MAGTNGIDEEQTGESSSLRSEYNQGKDGVGISQPAGNGVTSEQSEEIIDNQQPDDTKQVENMIQPEVKQMPEADKGNGADNEQYNPADNIPAVETTKSGEVVDMNGKLNVKADVPDNDNPKLKRIREVDMLRTFGYYDKKPETDEEREAREKQERNQRIIAAIGDGLSAFANMYYANRYAPNMINKGDKMASDWVSERQDKAKKEREDNDAIFRKAYEKAQERDREYEKTEREWLYKIQKAEMDRKLAEDKNRREEEKAERQAAIDDARLAWMNGRLTYQQYQNRIAEIKAGNASTTTGRTTNTSKTTGKKGGNAGGGKYPYYDKYGDVQYESTKEKAREKAIENGTWQEATTKTISKNVNGAKVTQTQKTPARSVKPKNPEQKPVNKSGSTGSSKANSNKASSKASSNKVSNKASNTGSSKANSSKASSKVNNKASNKTNSKASSKASSNKGSGKYSNLAKLGLNKK